VRGSAASGATVLVNDELATRTGADFYAGVPVLGLKENALKIQAATASPQKATTQTRSVLVPAVPEAFVYDLDGNLLQDGLWAYEWDAENRLIAQELRSDVSTTTWKRLEYSYDREGRRIRKLVKTKTSPSGTWTTASDTRFLYDGWNLVAEYSYASSTFTLLRSHAWGLDLSGSQQGAGGVGGLLWTTVAATAKTYAAAADANGNIIAYVDVADGSISGKRDYGAFGEALVTTGVASSLPFGFSTKYEEKETGLYYYGFRYYNPSTGGWLSRDPIEEDGGVNLYGMVNNNPVNAWDYLGLLLNFVPIDLGVGAGGAHPEFPNLKHGGQTTFTPSQITYETESSGGKCCTRLKRVDGTVTSTYWYVNDKAKTHELRHVADNRKVVDQFNSRVELYMTWSATWKSRECIVNLLNLNLQLMGKSQQFWGATWDATPGEYPPEQSNVYDAKAASLLNETQKLRNEIIKASAECSCRASN
jgi:RHS repeat-associated protein